ncbi:MAG TPA: CinA family nicotinamide mononucleotide deamidase-related protein [Acidimicrobiia bacterium]
MIVEVVAVGTELLLGQIENTNASYIGRLLAAEGLDSHYQVVVGDNLERLVDTIRTALERSDVVLLTGGIGPTQDDMTREAICEVTGRGMTRDEAHAEWIRQRISSQGAQVRPSQLRMADLPEGAEPLPNRTGVALGVALEHEGKLIFAMPGVPAEMKPMLEEQILPRIRRRLGGPQVIVSRVLHTWGMGESAVADLLADLYESSNPTIAFLIRDMEVRIRITAKSDSEAAGRLAIEPVEQTIRERLGEAVFAVDDETVEDRISEALLSRDWTVATVERATLGQVGARLASLPMFAGTVVPPAKEPLSPPQADVVLEVAAEDDDGGPTRAVAMVVTTPEGDLERTFRFGGDRERRAAYATVAGLHMIRLALD